MPEITAFDHAHDGVALRGRLALPDGEGRRPAVLVMHSGLGIGSLVERRAADLAAAGYVAFAPDMYGAQVRAGDQASVGPAFAALQERPDRMRARVVAAYAALRARPDVDAARIAAIGFCFGGQCALELARSGAALRAVVSFHGLLRTQRPAPAGAIAGKIVSISGALDPYVPAEDVAAFQAEMTAAGADWHTTIYSHGHHAFADPDIGRRDIPGVRYDPLLARLSWAAATEILSATLDDPATPADAG